MSLLLVVQAQVSALAQSESLGREGVMSAENTAVLFKQSGLKPDVVFTSLMTPCIESAQIVLAGMGMWSTPVSSSWRLNPRRCGLTVSADHRPIFPSHVSLPTIESACDLEQRVLPFWFDAAAPVLMRGKTVMISGHIDSLEVIARRLAPSVTLAPGVTVLIQVSRVLEGLGVEMLRPAEEKLSERELRKLRRAAGRETAAERAARKERNQRRKLRMHLKSSSSRTLSSAESNTSIMSSHVFSVPEEASCVESEGKVDADLTMNIVEETVKSDGVESTICVESDDNIDVDRIDTLNIVEETVKSNVMETTVDEGNQKSAVESNSCVEAEDKADADQTDALNIVEEPVMPNVMETTVDEGNRKSAVESNSCVEAEDKVHAEETVKPNVMETTVDEGNQKSTVESTSCVEAEDKVDADRIDTLNI
ncbi:MAG: hypothetical protein KVP17_001919, partial [Porospora cf. gigantea B]